MVEPVKELLDSKGIHYQHSGGDFLIKCLNPEHTDNNPSLRIDKAFGIGQCFACGFKLNIFRYFGILTDIQSIRVMKVKEKLDKIYAESVGLSIPNNSTPFTRDFRDIPGSIYKELEAFTHPDWEGRIVIPLKDVTGKMVAFLARHMHSDAKPRYIIYPKKVQVPLFPAKVYPVRNTLVLVEGIFDALNLMAKGMPKVCAIMGANSLHNDKEKINSLKLQGVSKIVLLFDGDAAGVKAAEELQPVLEKANFVVEVIDLPEGMDPGELSQSDVDKLKKMI